MNLNFFSWNVENNNSASFYQNLNKHLIAKSIDILILIECAMPHPMTDLAAYEELKDFLSVKGRRYVRIFLRRKLSIKVINAKGDHSNKLRMVNFQYNKFEFNLVAAHFYSKTSKSSLQQNADNIDMKKAIVAFETYVNNDKTIIAGDFNYLPFEPYLQDHNFLNAIGNMAVVRDVKSRNHQKIRHPFFYNPMWNLLGDYDYVAKKAKVNGTFYWHTEDVGYYHWNLLDGMVLSQTVMDKLLIESLQIETQINGNPLLHPAPAGSKNTYFVDNLSDHLPIKFTIKTI